MIAPKYHILICTGTKLAGTAVGTCATRGAKELIGNLNMALDDADLASDTIISGTTCFGMCDKGPIMVVYSPGADPVWYGNIDADAVEKIVEEHLDGGSPVSEYLL